MPSCKSRFHGKMFLIDIQTCNRSRAAVQVLVCTPHCKIRLDFLKIMGNCSNRMAKVKSYIDSSFMCSVCNLFHINELGASVESRRKKNKAYVICHRFNHIVLINIFSVPALYHFQTFIRIISMYADIAVYRIPVCREIQVIHNNLISFRSRLIESSNRLMHIHCCAHADSHLFRIRIYKGRTHCSQFILIQEVIIFLPHINSGFFPHFQRIHQRFFRIFAAQSKRVSVHVNDTLLLIKPLLEILQRIFLILFLRKRSSIFILSHIGLLSDLTPRNHIPFSLFNFGLFLQHHFRQTLRISFS